METGDGQCWNDKGVPWLRSPQESHILWLSPAVTFRTFPRAPGGQLCTVPQHSGEFPVCLPLTAPPSRGRESSTLLLVPRETHPWPCSSPKGLSPPQCPITLTTFNSFRPCRQHFKFLSHIWSGEFFCTAAGEFCMAGKPGGLCLLEPCQSRGEEKCFLKDKTLAGEGLLSLQQCTRLVSQERRGVQDVCEDDCGWQTAQGRCHSARRMQPHSQPGSQGRMKLPGNKAAAFPAHWGRGCSGELSHHHCLWEIFSLGSWQLLPAAHALLCLCLSQSSSSLKHLLGWNARLVLQLPPKAFQVLLSCVLNLWSEACPSLHTSFSLCFPS